MGMRQDYTGLAGGKYDYGIVRKVLKASGTAISPLLIMGCLEGDLDKKPTPPPGIRAQVNEDLEKKMANEPLFWTSKEHAEKYDPDRGIWLPLTYNPEKREFKLGEGEVPTVTALPPEFERIPASQVGLTPHLIYRVETRSEEGEVLGYGTVSGIFTSSGTHKFPIGALYFDNAYEIVIIGLDGKEVFRTKIPKKLIYDTDKISWIGGFLEDVKKNPLPRG